MWVLFDCDCDDFSASLFLLFWFFCCWWVFVVVFVIVAAIRRAARRHITIVIIVVAVVGCMFLSLRIYAALYACLCVCVCVRERACMWLCSYCMCEVEYSGDNNNGGTAATNTRIRSEQSREPNDDDDSGGINACCCCCRRCSHNFFFYSNSLKFSSIRSSGTVCVCTKYNFVCIRFVVVVVWIKGKKKWSTQNFTFCLFWKKLIKIRKSIIHK